MVAQPQWNSDDSEGRQKNLRLVGGWGRCNGLGEEGGAEMAKALPRLTSLRELHLGWAWGLGRLLCGSRRVALAGRLALRLG